MGSFEETFKGLLARYLRETYKFDVAQVVSYEQETRGGGYCDTCYYEEIVVEVRWLDSQGEHQSYDLYGSMASLIEDLAAFDREAE